MIPYVHRLTRLHDLFLYIALLLSFFAAAVGGGVSLFVTALFPLAMIGAHLFYRSGRAHPGQNRWWNALILLVLFGSALEYAFSMRVEPMQIGVRFVLILIIIKLFSRQGGRDELQLYALSFLTLAAASTFSEDFFYGIIFGLYVLAGTFGLALFHLKTEAGRHLQLRAPRKSPFDRFYVATLAGLSLLVFLSSLLIFFAFPRVGLGLFMEQSRQSLSVTGFSENIEVGGHGSVRDNPAVVMRVEFDGERPDNATTLRWRTMTFDTYQDGGWSRSHVNSERPAPYSRQRNYDLARLQTQALRNALDEEDTRVLQIYLEPLGTNVLPTLWPAHSIRLGMEDINHLIGASSVSLTVDAYGDLRHTMRSEIGLTYRLEIFPEPDRNTLRRQSGRQLNPSDAARYLQLPERLDPRIEALTREITADAASHFEKAEAIGAYFLREFEYTLDLPPVVGDDPVASFLFETRRGHCEYFASSAAVMLRTVGVPTRVVNGFLGGTWNEVGGYLTVRQGDAHAWVEIFVPELGWVPFEATPPIESSFLDRNAALQLLSDTTDALRQLWFKWILEYDLQSQAAMLRELGRSLQPRGAPETGSERTRVEAEDDDQGFPLRALIFFTGWLFLVGITAQRARTHHNPKHWRYVTGLLILSTIAALWVGWFQGMTPLWTTTGAASALAAGVLPLLSHLKRQDSTHEWATRHFLLIETAAARANIKRRTDEGPAAFLTRLEPHLDPTAQKALRTFGRLYLQLRFGGHPLDPASRETLKKTARTVSDTLLRR